MSSKIQDLSYTSKWSEEDNLYSYAIQDVDDIGEAEYSIEKA